MQSPPAQSASQAAHGARLRRDRLSQQRDSLPPRVGEMLEPPNVGTLSLERSLGDERQRARGAGGGETGAGRRAAGWRIKLGVKGWASE